MMSNAECFDTSSESCSISNEPERYTEQVCRSLRACWYRCGARFLRRRGIFLLAGHYDYPRVMMTFNQPGPVASRLLTLGRRFSCHGRLIPEWTGTGYPSDNF